MNRAKYVLIQQWRGPVAQTPPAHWFFPRYGARMWHQHGIWITWLELPPPLLGKLNPILAKPGHSIRPLKHTLCRLINFLFTRCSRSGNFSQFSTFPQFSVAAVRCFSLPPWHNSAISYLFSKACFSSKPSCFSEAVQGWQADASHISPFFVLQLHLQGLIQSFIN